MLKKLIVSAITVILLGAASMMPVNNYTASGSGIVISAEAASIDISGFKATIPYSSYTYRGRGIKPTVTVKDKSGNKLTKDTDFTVSYANNINVGTATITIRGKGKYTGTLKKTFKVKPLDLSTSYAKVTIPYSSYTYSGSAIKPAVKVKFKDGDIIPTAQYTLSYSNNVKVGTATIAVKGKGSNVTGTYKKTFVVKPAKNAIKSITAGVGSFKLTWTKATAGATGYQVLYSTDKNFVNNVHSYTSADLNDLSENFSKVPQPGETWYVKVRSFVTKDGKTTSTRYGNYSTVRSVKVVEKYSFDDFYAKEFINKTFSEIKNNYFKNKYSVLRVSAGQYPVVGISNTNILPNIQFGFDSMKISDVKSSDRPLTIEAFTGVRVNKSVTVGMSYNELKKMFGFRNAINNGGTWGIGAYVKIDGVTWFIQFDVSYEEAEKKCPKYDPTGTGSPYAIEYDLSGLNPKSNIAVYTVSAHEYYD